MNSLAGHEKVKESPAPSMTAADQDTTAHSKLDLAAI